MTPETNKQHPPIRWGKITASAVGLAFLELVKIAALAFVTIVVVRYFLFKPFYVKGASMEPNFYDHEYLIIDEITYRFREPERGEVVVFRYAGNLKEKDYYLKRIVGLPGERVKISEGKVIIYNEAHPEGVELNEPYLPDDLKTTPDKITPVGSTQYFVLGDNRHNSSDSRRFGPIERSAIVGRAWFRGWPFTRMQTFEAPEFNL